MKIACEIFADRNYEDNGNLVSRKKSHALITDPELAKKLFTKNINIALISGKSEYKVKKKILQRLENNKIDIIFGTHAIFQKKVIFKKLGLIIIDEQHKFGVNQRKKLSDKGGSNCDVLLMTATPIPRTLTMTDRKSVV